MNDLCNKQVVCEFFIFFSQFEYAIKKSGYLYGNENRALPDWDSFAEDIKDDFNPERTPELYESVDFLLKNPPKTQAIINGELSWEEYDNNEPNTENLKKIIKTVRNNLFHGGKIPFDSARDSELLKNCIIVLKEFKRLKPGFDQYFNY